MKVNEHYAMRSGNFENHIFTSIPTFKEAQVATADALIKSLPKNANVLDIGGTEGGFINTIAEVRPDVTGFIVDPNVVANKIFNQQTQQDYSPPFQQNLSSHKT